MCLSRVRSATSPLSRWFSSSSCFTRRVYTTPIPASVNLDFRIGDPLS
jgi:hypothetical protein